MNRQTVVIALGGSIIFPDKIDWEFLKKLRLFIKQHIGKGLRFVIAAGGGKISRMYIDAASKVLDVTNEDKDWLGIHATRSNAHLLRTIFRDVANPVVIDARHKIKKLKYPVTIASGWHPGWSTDYVAAVLAYDFHADTFIIAGKPDYVYTKDNTKNKDAKPIPKLSWRAYRKLIPSRFTPGAHAPVDPVAARFAEKHKLTGIVIDGRNIKNFKNLLAGRKFEGTVII